MNYNKADFIASYGISSQLPESDRPELSFSGRSNVGKSSLINKLCNRKNLARVSSTPGKTATINFYEVDDEVKKNLTFLPMSDLAQVLNAALLKPKSVSARHPHPAKKVKPVEAAIPPTPEKPKPGAVC